MSLRDNRLLRCERRTLTGLCNGVLKYSHTLPDEDLTSIYICELCGETTEVI